MIVFGAVSGSAVAALSRDNVWQGAVRALVVSGLNHYMHKMVDFQQQKKEDWDLNGDGILQKVEADLWGVKGDGKGIDVDDSKIDGTGLEILGTEYGFSDF